MGPARIRACAWSSSPETRSPAPGDQRAGRPARRLRQMAPPARSCGPCPSAAPPDDLRAVRAG
eukprot:375379-Pyramimonas_sp.AAC.1